MELNSYQIIYVIANFFGTYSIYKFFGVFFDRKNTNKKIEHLTYILYFTTITMIYFFKSYPIVMLLSNILLFFMISFNYRATLKKRIFSILFMYMILLCIEEVVVLISSNFTLTIQAKNEYASIWGLICVKIVSYMIIIFADNFHKNKHDKIIPNTYWFALSFIPLASLYLILMLLMSQNMNTNFLLIGIVIVFLFNFIIFYLFDEVSCMLEEKMNQQLLLQQNSYYDQQLKLMSSSLKISKSIKHDLKNHLLAIDTLVRKDKKIDVLMHIENMLDSCEFSKEYAHSGNIVLDSILNFKLMEIEKYDILLNLDINIPDQLIIKSFDLSIIFGNLLDNSINAAKNSLGKKFIDIKICYNKGRLLTRIKNSFSEELQYEDNKLITSNNNNKQEHGIGLLSIENVLRKYNGFVESETKEDIFMLTIILYVK